MRMTVSTKMFLDRQHVVRKVGEGRARGLRRAGAMVYRSAQKQFLTSRTKTVTNRVIGRFRGLPLVERRTRRSNPTRITTWPSARSPKGFLRSMLAFAWDDTTKTVVVGPRSCAWLARLHEKGQTQVQRLYLRFSGKAIRYQRALGLNRTGKSFRLAYVGSFISPRSSTGSFVATAITRVIRVRQSSYMENGLAKVRQKLPERLRDQIRGP